MTQIHMIKKGETLSSLAKLYNTDVTTLQELNAEQIKDINLIYTGDELITPEESAAAQWESQDKEIENTLPNTLITQSECSKNVTLVDVLYVPSILGERGKSEQKFLFLAQEAVDAVKAEHDVCAKAVAMPDNVSRVAEMGKLGVLDAFNSLSHEVFLRMNDSKENSKDADNYREALFIKALLSRQVEIEPENLTFPEDNRDIGVSGIKRKLEIKERLHNRQEETLERIFRNRYGENYLQLPNAAEENKVARTNLKNRYRRALIGLLHDVFEDVEDKVADYEKKAKKIAKSVKLAQGELNYEFSEFGYYSSAKGSAVFQLLNTVREYRQRASIDVPADIKDLKSDTEIVDLDRVEEFYNLWKSHSHEIIVKRLSDRSTANWYMRRTGYSTDRLKRDFIHYNVDYPTLMSHIVGLNLLSVAVKEQCLTEAQLLSGKAEVNRIREKFENQTSTLSQLKSVLSKLKVDTLGYYPAYVLQLLIVREVATRIKDFKDLVGKNQEYVAQVSDMLPYAHQCQARIDSLREKAEQQKSNSLPLYYRVEGAKFAGQVLEQQPMQLIWDEHDYQPEDLTNQLYATNSSAQCHIVECALASEPNKRLYIRSNHAVLSDKLSQHKNCVVGYQFSPIGGATGDGNMKGDTSSFVDMKKLDASLEAKYGTVLTWSGGKKLADVDDVACFPWFKEDVNLFGVEGSADLSASAQFMRFVWSGQGSASSKEELITGNSKTDGKYELKMGLNAAAGQSNMTLTLPKKEMSLKLPYIHGGMDASNNALPETKQERNIGSFQVLITGAVYGSIAASLNLSTELDVGNTANGLFGVRGTTPTSSGFANFSAGDEPAKVEGKAFAGLEVGGSVNCAFNWKPTATDAKNLNLNLNPNHPFLNLFKVGGGVRGTLGIGAECSFTLTFNGSRFIVIFNAGVTKGIGCGGKISAELNPQNIEAFLSLLLSITNSNSFKRFAFFDEEGRDDETFKALNTVMTVAISYGLGVGVVTMLPFKLIREMESRAQEEKNAGFVANFINNKDYADKNALWIKNALPETLSKLLTVLTHYHDIPDHWYNWASEQEANSLAEQNAAQSNAILQIFKWLGAESTIPKTEQLDRFENAVQRMYLKDPTSLDPGEKWEKYAENLLRVRRFFALGVRNKYEYTLGEKLKSKKYDQLTSENYRGFIEYIERLTNRTRLYQKINRITAADFELLRVSDYQASDDAIQMRQQGYKEFDWKWDWSALK
ncbi:LysM peptidoglycan-binding domain-containing protein [Marinomonas foliarum]|uniref:LysM peptidoglycan-binding domain-containing protein n=1 Tax=Marinomonas foliarum TaxID=491950 RepID=A0ABX7IRK5_9GAMM|nr:LysM domain-containing protein [Marinomonas foliarum]QRV24895.1 LysM peptidoglycan-binding domain-containing protein [Marinomonas foliarum]